MWQMALHWWWLARVQTATASGGKQAALKTGRCGSLKAAYRELLSDGGSTPDHFALLQAGSIISLCITAGIAWQLYHNELGLCRYASSFALHACRCSVERAEHKMTMGSA